MISARLRLSLVLSPLALASTGLAPHARATNAEPGQRAEWHSPPISKPPQAPRTDLLQLESSWVIPSLHALGLMTVMRTSEAVLWPDPFADTSLLRFGVRYADAFTLPPRWDGSRNAFEWDGDRWFINVVGHGLFGSELYLRARTCRKPLWQALLFTTLASGVWEYGFEANGVRPSALDLTFTPLSGWVLGEARFWTWSAASSLRPGVLKQVLQVAVDPLGELERGLGAPC